MNDTSQHLTLEELAGDSDLTATAQEHLSTCEHCWAQARDWAAVASGARHIIAGAQPSSAVLGNVMRALEQDNRTRRPGRTRKLLPYAAAAAVVLGAGGYGLTAALGSGTQGGGSGTPAGRAGAVTTAAGLAATGCRSLDLTAGTLTQASGQKLIVTTSSGHRVPVTVSADTSFLRVRTGVLTDITDGARVMVVGDVSGGTVTATTVTILPETVTGPGQLSGGGPGAEMVLAGAVSNASSTGFTVTNQGHSFQVTMSSATTVITTVRISASQLRIGETTTATGRATADGTLAASTVEQLDVPAATWRKMRPSIPAVPSGPSGGLAPSVPAVTAPPLTSLGCASSAVTTTYLLTAATS